LAKVYEVFKAVKIPVIGMGGITSWEDAIEFFLVGAVAVQIGTANFITPSTGVMIAEKIHDYCVEQKLDSVDDLVGGLIADSNVSIVQSWL
jgi:dihydroorotate dehydrogenase (NAD+) catalytic subunit